MFEKDSLQYGIEESGMNEPPAQAPLAAFVRKWIAEIGHLPRYYTVKYGSFIMYTHSHRQL